jgi:diacylglycerol kinase family enzyme
MSTSRALLLFANPLSGAGEGQRLAARLTARLTHAGYQVDLHTEPACGISTEMLNRSPAATAAIVVGGDGTLLSVAARLLEAFGPAHVPPLLAVPLGTANLMARHLDCLWPREHLEDQVLAALQGQTIRRVDVARANGQPFLLVAGVGFDASVIHKLAAARRGPINYAHYLRPALASLLTYRFPPLTIEADGALVLTDTPAIAFAGNVPQYGGGFTVTPRALSDDGMLDLCILPCRDWRELFELGCICGAGLQIEHERAIYRRVHRIAIHSAAPVPVELDGEDAGFTPLQLAITGQQLRFIVRPDGKA